MAEPLAPLTLTPLTLAGLDPARAVLVVEPCAQQANTLLDQLAQLGLAPSQLDWAPDAASAGRLCRERAYQLLLCNDSLGDDQADGAQLLATLCQEGWLAPDCVLVMMADDASLARLRRLAALELDGYLLKPVQPTVLAQRWPHWLARRQQLAPIQALLGGGLLAEAEQQAAATLAQAPVDAPGLRLLQARIWMDQRQFDRAHNALLDLRGGPEGKRAQLALAELAMRRRYYALADSWLTALESDPLLGAQALALGAENALREHKFVMARQKLLHAISLTPCAVRHHWLLACVELADGTLLAAHQALLQGLQLAPLGVSWAGQLLPLLAALQLDMAAQAEPEAAPALLQQFQQQCGDWQQRVGQSAYRPMALLLLGRFYCLQGSQQQAAFCLTQYQMVRQHQPGPRSPLEQVERVKLLRLLGSPLADELLGQLNRRLAEAGEQVEHLAWRLYLARWCALNPVGPATDSPDRDGEICRPVFGNEVFDAS
ncbi:hypothetical protein ABHF91_04565 [Pseudaeromonas sp. ZJS20]|uniref:hypothetical protein n=1 Tax=Pseudaeromonas aegiceratis TaxID=3153928 RepID=UPI00390CD9A5